MTTAHSIVLQARVIWAVPPNCRVPALPVELALTPNMLESRATRFVNRDIHGLHLELHHYLHAYGGKEGSLGDQP